MTIGHNDPRFIHPGDWLKPYLAQANPMMERIATAYAGGPAITNDEIETWRAELKALMPPDAVDLLEYLNKVRSPDLLVYIAGRMMGRVSLERRRALV